MTDHTNHDDPGPAKGDDPDARSDPTDRQRDRMDERSKNPGQVMADTVGADDAAAATVGSTVAPDGERNVADVAQIAIPRDEQGEQIGVWRDVGEFGEMKFLPMPMGAAQKYFGDGTTARVDFEDLAAVLRDKIVDPDLDELAHDRGYETFDGDCLSEEILAGAAASMMSTLAEVSGLNQTDVDVGDSGAQIDFGDGEGNSPPRS